MASLGLTCDQNIDRQGYVKQTGGECKLLGHLRAGNEKKWICTLTTHMKGQMHLSITIYWNLPWSSLIINSYPPSATYVRQWIGSALVQIMARRLFSTKPLNIKQFCFIVKWTFRNTLQWHLNQNTKFVIHENVSEDIHFVQKETR